MKAIILAGGLGTRLSEETILKPKPMVEIGGMPIIWHIMKTYSYHGINDFIICCGYKGYLIKEYFINYFYHKSDITISLNNNTVTIHDQRAEPWNITLIDTGEVTMTGGRLKRVKEFIKNEEAFCFTYGDGLSDINITELIDFHKSKNKLATISVVYPPGRFGAVEINNNSVTKFTEKPKGDGSLINGGFFVLSPKVIDFIDDDSTIWEGKPLDTLAQINQMSAFIHNGFWQPMDTLRDKEYLENLWNSGNSPWKVW
jgi:glucose-1-phosphate cytidylyltransferase